MTTECMGPVCGAAAIRSRSWRLADPGRRDRTSYVMIRGGPYMFGFIFDSSVAIKSTGIGLEPRVLGISVPAGSLRPWLSCGHTKGAGSNRRGRPVGIPVLLNHMANFRPRAPLREADTSAC